MTPLFQIKICGITTPADALMACQNGADAVGLNFYIKSSRFIKSADAESVRIQVDQFNAKAFQKVWKVGVFVNPTDAELLEAVDAFGLDAIQFHGNESREFVARSRKLVRELEPDCQMIRALSARLFSNSVSESSEMERVQAEIRSWESVGIDAILLDAAADGEFGGTGQTLDWRYLNNLIFTVPFILAGGLNPENVSMAIRLTGAQGVDVASGVETEPGRKDNEKVRSFVRNTGWR